MTAHLAAIYRHPIKSHGRENMQAVVLTQGQCMPWDRHWAVTHERSKWQDTDPQWLACTNFLIGSGNPRIMAINAVLDQAGPLLTLTHPDLPPLAFHPNQPDENARFLDWLAPLVPEGRAATALVKAPGRGMTDSDYPSVSLANLASGTALSERMGEDLSPLRWRCNLWVEGWHPWAENDLLGRRLQVGAAVLAIRERIGRCKSTTANPGTGRADVDTLAGLRSHTGAQDFGVYAEVVVGGELHLGDRIEVLA